MKRRPWSQRLTQACLVMLALMAPMASRAGTTPIEIAPQWIRWGNGLRTEWLIFNALSTNPGANLALTKSPLSTASFSSVPELKNALHDPAARIFMKYLVSCALGEDQEVSWTPASPGMSPQTWHGGGALCRDWGVKPPTQDCLELVSSCILARNNPKGVMVRILLQGGGKVSPPASLTPLNRVTPAQYIPSRMLNTGLVQDAQPILSFQPCDTAAGGDCGWRSVSVGACTEGARVTFSVSSSKGRAVCGALRACTGSRGCDQGEELGSTKTTFCATGSLDFTCPSGGMFSVMTSFTPSTSGPYDSLWDTQTVIGTGARLMIEKELFPQREGAFYGNIFGSDAIISGLSVTFEPSSQETILRMVGSEFVYVRQGEGWCKRLVSDPPSAACTDSIPRVGSGRSVYEHMYVCSAGWPGNPVDLPGRVCALPHNGENCASHLMGDCLVPTEGDCAPYGDNLDLCRGREQRWSHPITTFMSW